MTASGQVEVLVVDDHPVVRTGLRTLLTAEGMTVVGEASSGEEAVALVAAEPPDVVVMDLAMGGMSGIEATRRIVETSPRVAVLVVSMSGDEETVFAALRAGARGYLLKGSDPAGLVRAVLSVAAGEAVVGAGVADRMLGFFSTAQATPAPELFPHLTDREREVLGLLAKGLSNPEIGRALDVRPKTVRNHVSNVLAKLAAADRTQAVLMARDAGLG